MKNDLLMQSTCMNNFYVFIDDSIFICSVLGFYKKSGCCIFIKLFKSIRNYFGKFLIYNFIN